MIRFVISAPFLSFYINNKSSELASYIHIAFGEDAVIDEVTKFWFCQFKNDKECSKDEQLQDHPENCNIKEIKQSIV